MAQSVNIVWPGWDVGDCIGKGGYGVVYEIRREVFGDVERCALKVITIPKDASEIEYMRCEGMDDESITTTLHAQVGDIIREYKMMSRMRENPNIVHCDDFRYTRHEDDLGWDIYIKMELLTPLMKALDRVQTEEQIIRLGKDLCNALMTCQKYNIIHRDIKPQNIFLSPEGYFKLGDFGIARTMEHTTRATAGIGTYSFMAPEVALGKSYGPTVDIYSLGLVLYWLLNERRSPFVPLPPAVPTVAVNEEARLRRYSGEQIPPPKHGSKELIAVVLKACAFDPRVRYQTAQEMQSSLEAIEKKQREKSKIMASENEFTSLNERTVIDTSANTSEGKTTKRNGGTEDLTHKKRSGTKAGFYLKETHTISQKSRLKWAVIVGCVVVVLTALILVGEYLKQSKENQQILFEEKIGIKSIPETAAVTFLDTSVDTTEEDMETKTLPTETISLETVHIVDPDAEIRNILLMNQPTGEDVDNQNPDTIILCTINRTSKTLTITSVLKDIFLKLPDYMGHFCGKNKINTCYYLGKTWGGNQGPTEMMNLCLNENFGVIIDENIEINDMVIEKIVDLIGGVEICLDQDEVDYLKSNCKLPVAISRGIYNIVDGKTALAYSQIAINDSNIGRTERQRELITAIIEKCRDLDDLYFSEITSQIFSNLNTDMSVDEITAYFREVLDYSIISGTCPKQGTFWGTIVTIGEKSVAALEYDDASNREYMQSISETDSFN